MKKQALQELYTEYTHAQKALKAIIKKQADHYALAQTAEALLIGTAAAQTLQQQPLPALPLTAEESAQVQAAKILLERVAQKYHAAPESNRTLMSLDLYQRETLGHCLNAMIQNVLAIQLILTVGYTVYGHWQQDPISFDLAIMRYRLNITPAQETPQLQRTASPILHSSPLSHEPAQQVTESQHNDTRTLIVSPSHHFNT